MDNKIDCTELETMVKYYNDRDEHEKHLKGYMYDSLVYRYQLILYKASLRDVEDFCLNGMSRGEAEKTAKHNYTRDLMRFIQILDEAIGEHD
jgi:hypothetical protein